jgi:hypothetical protein
LKIAEDFSRALDLPLPSTQMRLTQQLTRKLIAKANEEWAPVIEHLSSNSPSLPLAKAEDDLAAWLENIQGDDGLEEPKPDHCAHPKINQNRIGLYRCSHCGNPSAALRKCASCSKAR